MATFIRLKPNILINQGYSYYKIMKLCHEKYHIGNNDDGATSKETAIVEHDVNNDPTVVLSDDLVEPTTCCMSGCSNCVWIEYAEKLSNKLTNSNDEIQKIILTKVTDPNMRAFLLMELRCRNLMQ